MRKLLSALLKATALCVIACSFFETKVPDGVDVSRHQGKINWETIGSSLGKDKFVYVKCTEGATYTDPTYAVNAKKAKKAGFHVGGYHYFRMTSTPQKQFDNFKSALRVIDTDIIPMVDVETTDGHSVKATQKALKQFLNLIEKEYGVKPMIYGTNSSYNKICAPTFNDYPLYIGRYGDNAPIVKGAGTYTIWQFSDKTILPGCSKPVDLCRFHSSKSIKDILL